MKVITSFDKMEKILIEDLSEDKSLPGPKPKKKSRLTEKIVFVCTSAIIVILSHCAIRLQWLLPYLYAVLTPTLIGIRIIMYWKNKWHYFLLDFCYFANILLFVFLSWPDQPYIFSVIFALSNGPLIWAMLVYRNSLVLHSIDKVTSTYIHILPPLLTFCARWYPEEMSKYWFKAFMPEMPEFSIIWIVLIPLACFVAHSGLYSLIVNVLVKPSDDHVTSYSYLGEKDDSCLYKLFNCCGQRCRCGMFYFFNWLFCIVSLISSVLCYFFFEAHCVVIVFLSLVAMWNGASYYVHVFAVRGFVTEIE